MKPILLFTLLATVAAADRPDPNGWNNITWGMTVAEARAALGPGAKEPTEPPGPNFTLITRLILPDVLIAGAVARAAIQTARGQDHVTAVTLTLASSKDDVDRRPSIYADLSRLLREKYGQPRTEQGRPPTRTTLWILPRTSITLNWSESRYGNGSITITYQAVDPKSLEIL